MNKVSELRLLFRTINQGLTKVEELNMVDQKALLRSLKIVNEEMCDQVIELVKAYELLKANQ